jgi:hypothetical protein
VRYGVKAQNHADGKADESIDFAFARPLRIAESVNSEKRADEIPSRCWARRNNGMYSEA